MITHPSAHSPASLAPLPGAAPGVRLLCLPASPRGYSWWGGAGPRAGRGSWEGGAAGQEFSAQRPQTQKERKRTRKERVRKAAQAGAGGPGPPCRGLSARQPPRPRLAAALMLVPASSSRPTGESRGLPEQPPWTPCLESRPPAPTWQSFVPLGSCPSCRPLCTIPCGVGS